ncbi:MAG: GWxTD domain-containing protein [Candidatus Krumholzibacteriia bacterium]
MNRAREAAAWLTLAAVVCLAACGPPSGPRWADQPSHALQAWVSVEAAADGTLRPVVEAEVPRHALVFERRPDGAFQARFGVSVTALRGDDQVGGGVAEATVRQAAADGPVRVRVPLLLRGLDPVDLVVIASQAGTARSWRRVLHLAPATLRAAPLVITDVTVAPLTADAGSLDLVADCFRPLAAGAWPDAGVSVRMDVTAADGRTLGPRQQPVLDAPAIGDSLRVALAWPVRDLPFGRLDVRLSLVWQPGAEVLRLPYEPDPSVVNLQVPVLDDATWRRHVAWLDGLVPDHRRDQLADLPPPARAVAWRELWLGLAAGDSLTGSRLRTEHLLRIVAADERFGGYQRGALSDRGRMFVRRGEPDHVEQTVDARVPGAVWEIWTYERDGIRCFFHDANGLGDFRLRRQEPLVP